MASTFTPNLNLEKPDDGDQSGVWGTSSVNPNWDKVDAKFHGTTGHSHDGSAGEGPQLDHDVSLTNVGTNTHAQIDSALADHETRITDEETTSGDHENRITNLEATTFASAPARFSPVSFLDLFTYPTGAQNTGYDIFNSPWVVDANDPNAVILGTGDSLVLNGDPSENSVDTPAEVDVLLTAPIDPHSVAQRSLTNVSRVDLANLAVGDGVHVGLSIFGARSLGSNQFIDDGILTTTSVAKTGANSYDVVKSVNIVTAGTTVKSLYLDAQTGLTEANALPLILGTHELSADVDGRIYLYHDRVLLLRTNAGILTSTFITDMQTELTGAGLPEWGAGGVYLGYTIDPLNNGTTQIEIRYAGVYGTGDISTIGAEPGTSTANRAAAALDVVGELCVTGGFWDGTSVGDQISYLDGTYKVVACSNDPYGFVIDDFVTGPAGARASVIPGAAMTSSGIVPPYRSAIDDVAPQGAPPPDILEGTEGQVIDVIMATNVPPDVQVTASAGITIRDVRYIDHNTVRLFFDTDPATDGDPFTVTFTSEGDGGNTYNETIATIADAPPEFVSFTATDSTGATVDPPTEGTTVNYTLKVKNVDAGATVNFTGADVTGQTFVIVDSTTITGTLTHAEPKTGAATSVTVTNPSGDTFTEELFTIVDALPVADYVTINTTVAPTVGATGTIVGQHFDADVTVAVIAGGGLVANLVPTFVNSTLINFTIDINLNGPPDVQFQVTNAAAGNSTNVNAFLPGPDVAPVQAANGDTIQEGLPNQPITISGVGLTFDQGARISASVSGTLAITGFTPGGAGLQQDILATFSPDPGTAGPVTFTVTNPNGLNSAVLATNPIANEPTPTGPFVYTPSGTFQPGDSGTLTIDAASGFVNGVVASTSNPATDIALGATTFVSPTQITVPYNVPITATPGTTINLTFTNPGTTANTDSVDIAFPPPVINDIKFDANYENQAGIGFVIRGSGFQAGATLDFTLGDAGVINVVVGVITSETITGTCDFQSSTAGNNITFEVENPDLQADTDTFQIAPTPTPVIAQFVVDENEEGATAQTLYITGKFLYPTATYGFTGGIFSNIVEVSRSMTEWVFTVDVSGTAGDTGGIEITYDGDLYAFPDLLTVELDAPGPTTITSVVLGALTANATGVAFTINGTGLGASQVDEVRFPVDVPARLPLAFLGQDVATNITILTQSSTQITGTLDINGSGSGVAVNQRWGLEQRRLTTEVYFAAALVESDATQHALLADANQPDLSLAEETAFLAVPANLLADGAPRAHTFTFAKVPPILAGLLQSAALPLTGTPGVQIVSTLFLAPNQFQVTFIVEVGVAPGTDCEILFTDTVPAIPANPYSVIRFQST